MKINDIIEVNSPTFNGRAVVNQVYSYNGFNIECTDRKNKTRIVRLENCKIIGKKLGSFALLN